MGKDICRKTWRTQSRARRYQKGASNRYTLIVSPSLDLANWSIASKYKEYNKLRASLKDPVPVRNSPKRISSPTGSINSEHRSPKRQKVTQPLQLATHDQHDSPPVERTPARHRACLGPTPQKDGRVLGLFDLLSPASNSSKTPQKKTSLGVISINALETPTKRGVIYDDRSETSRNSSPKKLSRSPIGTSKGHCPNTFTTPSSKRAVKQHTPASKSSFRSLALDETPAFLRRDSQRLWTAQQLYDELDGEPDKQISWSPLAVRKPSQPVTRGLSALVKGLRDMQDERLDEEMEMLREMEYENEQGRSLKAGPEKPKIVVEDSQVQDMPLGPDGSATSNDDDDCLDDGKRLDKEKAKIWKKKGQKRTTRKTNIKPSTAKWKPEPQWKGDNEAQDDMDEVALVEKTQIDNAAAVEDNASDTDDLGYLDEEIQNRAENWKPVKSMTSSNQSHAPTKATKTNLPKKKKMSATAHANFRALKIKNKNSKAKKGARFVRGRR